MFPSHYCTVLLAISAVSATRLMYATDDDPTQWAGIDALAQPYPYESWMADHFEILGPRKLVDVTLPGSHNSGNTPDLSWENMFAGDDRYSEFQSYLQEQGAVEKVSREEYYERFVRWNVNHFVGVDEQLKSGIRWFHLKICKTNDTGELALDNIHHCHRGFMGPTLGAILHSIVEFLEQHPREIVVLGINNVYGLTEEEVVRLPLIIDDRSRHVTDMMDWSMMNTLSIANIITNNKRLALFMSVESPKAIDSRQFLIENWGAAGDSGNLAEYTRWMRQDVVDYATKRDKYYVLQANPNNNPNDMYASVLHNQVGSGLFGFEYPFLRNLSPFVLSVKKQVPGARICAISTDFMHTARVTEVALALLHHTITS